MKSLFIEAQRKIMLNKADISNLNKKLPSKIAIFYSIQYSDVARQIKKALESKKNKKITCFQQVLGCTKLQTSVENHNILLISSGRFHALQIVLHITSKISKKLPDKLNFFIFNPENKQLSKLSYKEIENLRKKRKSALINFLSTYENERGIIVSCKPGQIQLKKALYLRKKYHGFIFLGDDIISLQLENFSCKAWLNIACSGLALDNIKIVNYEDILKQEIF